MGCTRDPPCTHALLLHSPRVAHSLHTTSLSMHSTHRPHASGHCLCMYASLLSHCPAFAHLAQFAEASAHRASVFARSPDGGLGFCTAFGFGLGHMVHERGHSIAMNFGLPS